jgi:hypothetical protein
MSSADRYVGTVLKNSEAKNKTCTRVRYFFVSRVNLGFMSLSNANITLSRTRIPKNGVFHLFVLWRSTDTLLSM